MTPVQISKFLVRNEAWLNEKTIDAERRSALARKQDLMDAGDNLRKKWDVRSNGGGRGDAGAFAAIMEILAVRAQHNDGVVVDGFEPEFRSLKSHAYVIDSLKHPDELDRLRRIYGPAFISIGVYAPKLNRNDNLVGELEAGEENRLVEALIRRDEDDVKLGQHVADAFYATDFIVDATRDSKEIRRDLRRLVELLFGNVHLTPSSDEFGMFLARSAQVRSSSLARQIGAAVLRSDGTVASLGTNEVAKAIVGGQYWPMDDSHRGRDKDYCMPESATPRDTSDWWREEMISDAIERLNDAGKLNADLSNRDKEGRLNQLVYADSAPLRQSKIKQNIDYVRAVHAEAAAIIDAGRHGTSLLDTTMYTTTFPCHECGRHIVAAGVREVIYLEPYPKSAVQTLYADSIVVDPSRGLTDVPDKVVFRTFVGVSPTRYLEFFTLGKRQRKDSRGEPILFELKTASPDLPYYTPTPEAIANTEFTQSKQFSNFVLLKGAQS